ncbi:hypothetical protein G3O06_32055 [Burkholderia sp. Ac-20345]|uniref:TorF family putative porin n=1 Tax=Burkholderia sp. Ac-20345 TaxID=2703891 RepID=UPI00197B793D|nr:TorF family putative porin [Burkholderia sp. Ac-20345]MBN3782140.1 hypothetical protein [Burkholderia sp. Ac-20345]
MQKKLKRWMTQLMFIVRPCTSFCPGFRNFRLTAQWLILVFLGMACRVADAALEDWRFELGVASDKVSRGLDLSNRRPSLQAAASWYPGNGLFAGASVSAFPRTGLSSSIGTAVDVDAGYVWRLDSKWQAQVAVANHQLTGSSFSQSMTYRELAATVRWQDAIFATVSVSPDTPTGRFRGLHFVACDLVARLPLAHGVTATAGIGYYDLHTSDSPGSGYGNVGLSYQYRAVQLEILYIGTIGRSKSLVQGALDNHWIFQTIWHF